MMKSKLLSLLMMLVAAVANAAPTVDELIAEGDLAYEHHDYEEAMKRYGLVMVEYQRGITAKRMGDAFNWAGNACMNTGHYSEALEFYTTAIILSQQNRDTRLYRDLLSNVGIVFGIFKDYEQAISYFDKAFALAQQQRDNYLMAITIVNLAIAHYKAGNTLEARNYIELQAQYALPDSALHQFFCYYTEGLDALTSYNPRKALAAMHGALGVVRDQGLDKNFMADVYNEMASAYLLLAQRDSAIACYKMTTAIGWNSHYHEQQRDAFKGLERTYMLMGQRDSAVNYQSLYINLTDSFFNQRKFNLAKNQLTRFEEELGQQQIARLDGQITHQRFVIGIISVLLLVVGGFAVIIFRYNRNLRSANQMLVSKHDELVRQEMENKQLRDDYLLSLREKPSGKDAVKSHDDQGALLTKERREQLLKDINEVMENIDIIADPEFNLHSLAKLVGSNTKYVSMVINDSCNKNFKSYLNEYRIREACHRFAQPEKYGNLTISGIAGDLGYNSANSFIIAFKKIIGMTPSVYIKLVREKNG